MADNNLREQILGEIERRAPHYTPEWRYNEDHPDAGTALAMLWADMHSGSLERFDMLHDNFRRALLDAIGSDPRPAVPAAGFLAFGSSNEAGNFIIPKGTQVAAPSNVDAVLVTSQNLPASAAKISAMYSVLPQDDSIRVFDRLENTELIGHHKSAPHVWTFTHAFALNISRRASLRLVPDIDAEGIDVLINSKWEFEDDEAWREMSVVRDGLSLLCVFPKDKLSVKALRVSVTKDAVLKELIAKPSGIDLLPDALYSDGTQARDGFFPFGQRFIPGLCAYFSNADALTKPGARVELSFTLSFEEFEIEGYPQIPIQMRNIMRPSEFDPPEEFEIWPSEVKWEYFNGVGWAALDIDAKGELFGGGTVGRIKLAFDCPHDMSSAVVGAHELPFIRARLVAVDNLYRQNGQYKSPFLCDIRFNYRYERGISITDISVAEHLDIFKKALPARLAAKPDGPPALYFASLEAFTRGTILFHLKPNTSPMLRWEYLSRDGWVLLDVRDETNRLAKTGILSYQAVSPAAKKRLWGRDGYWLRLVFEDKPQTDPYLYGLYENAVRAVAKTPGEDSALPAGAFTTIITPMSAVVTAFNPLAVFGGANKEDEAKIIRRMSGALSHSGKAVSRLDCERLAMEASLRVRRVKYYPHTDENGRYAYGHACLVVLAHEAEQYRFEELREEIMTYLEKRRALGSEKLKILSPRYIAVNVSANIMIQSHSDAMSVKDGIEDTLALLLSPESRDIGQLPAPGQISTAIRAVKGVFKLTKCDVSYTMTTGVRANYTRAVQETFILPVNAEHEYVFIDRGIV